MFEKGPKTRIVMHICWGKDTKEKIGWKFDGRDEIYSLGGYLSEKNDDMVEIRFFHITITISKLSCTQLEFLHIQVGVRILKKI